MREVAGVPGGGKPEQGEHVHEHRGRLAVHREPAGEWQAAQQADLERVEGRTRGRQLTRLAVSATVHCLTGCAIGEVLGMVLATWWGWGDVASIVVSVALAFFFGYSLTVGPVLRAGLPLRRAIRVALAADTVSIVVMELIDSAVVLAVPGAMEAHLDDVLFWGSLAFALVAAFVVTVPVNRALIARGKGHAVVHEHHH